MEQVLHVWLWAKNLAELWLPVVKTKKSIYGPLESKTVLWYVKYNITLTNIIYNGSKRVSDSQLTDKKWEKFYIFLVS